MDDTKGDSAESFAVYLARYLIAESGFQPGTVAEANAIAENCDIVLTRMDGVNLEIAGIVDCEQHPDKQFALDRAALEQIGKECLKYTGSVSAAKMPVIIRIFEIGPSVDTPERRTRLRNLSSSFYSKVRLYSWIVDTAAKSVTTNTFLNGRFVGRPAIERLLREPRRDASQMQAPNPVAEAPESTPFLTYALLAILAAAFACEIAFGIGGFTKLLEPSITTLSVMGGLSRPAVFADGEWHRLIAATFLHADVVHLALNGIVLFFVGRALEQIVGHAWFGAIYAVSAICGAFMSLALLSPNIVSVGASGAIMGLLGAAFVISFRYPKGAARTQLQMLSIQVLIPSLLPLAPAATGQQVDFGAHLGGMLGGAAVGIVMLMIWSRQSPLPRLRWIAAAAAAAWVAAAGMALVPVTTSHAKASRDIELRALLIPESEMPKAADARTASSEDLVARFPRDPRARLYRATAFLDQNDFQKAEEELRLALKEEEILRAYFQPAFEHALRATLAFTLVDAGKLDDAKQAAKPACGHYQGESDAIRENFKKLCE